MAHQLGRQTGPSCRLKFLPQCFAFIGRSHRQVSVQDLEVTVDAFVTDRLPNDFDGGGVATGHLGGVLRPVVVYESEVAAGEGFGEVSAFKACRTAVADQIAFYVNAPAAVVREGQGNGQVRNGAADNDDICLDVFIERV